MVGTCLSGGDGSGYNIAGDVIPEFPEFKKLELEDRAEIENITKDFPPYSDFNFTSLWCWDVKGGMAVSVLNSNLVVKFSDYLSGQPYFSFIGAGDPNKTALQLLDFLEIKKLPCKLRLVPEFVATNLSSDKLKVLECRGDFDYIYSTESLSKMEGSKFETKRNQVNRFVKRNNDITTRTARVGDKLVQDNIVKLLEVWERNKIDASKDVEIKNEETAIRRIFDLSKVEDLTVILVEVEKKIVGFSIFEVVNAEYGICHFHKTDTRLAGIYDYTMREKAQHLFEKKIMYINYEQDLDIDTLRHAKNSYRPVFFLKKYEISKI